MMGERTKEKSANVQNESVRELTSILSDCRKQNAPFLLFRYPGVDIALASCDVSAKYCFSFSPFHYNKRISVSDFSIISLNNLEKHQSFKSLNKLEKVQNKEVQLVDKLHFIKNVKLAKTKIEQGLFQKVVLSKVKKVAKSISPIETFISLEKKYQTALVYCFYHPLCGLWIGASPEKLIEKDHTDQYHIHSLAGTKRLDEKWTIKEVNEQKIVTDYITSKLSADGAENLEVEGPMDYHYGQIKHLKSSVHFHSKSGLNDLVNLIHPTPAVCGMPLEESKKFILENEGYDRSFYTGHIGLSGFDHFHDTYFVNLRCMCVMNQNSYIYTGAGIVADSDPQNEWEEVEAKAKTLIECIKTNGQHN